MSTYSPQDVLRIAKRVNNTKRPFLLVNPLQGKHIPVSPTKALAMMQALGNQLQAKYPQTRLIVGFAETATAIGAAVASCFGSDARYMHTTREELPGAEWLYFLEEHSHAAEQKLHRDGFLAGLENTPTIIFVEDELSTGKTLLNMLTQLRSVSPAAARVKMVAASIINRLSDENMQRLENAGITCEYLVKLPEVDYAAQVESMEAAPALCQEACSNPPEYSVLPLPEAGLNPRVGVNVAAYEQRCRDVAEAIFQQMSALCRDGARILVLGTEECMYPALVTGRYLEDMTSARVFCHATTRSPIGVCSDEGYPIRNGYHLRSFYEENRNTFLYELADYDAVIVLSDTRQDEADAMAVLGQAFRRHGCPQLYFCRM